MRQCGWNEAATGFYVEDVDGDGVLEDQISSTLKPARTRRLAGSLEAPVFTVSHAFNSRADGALTGGEDIVCARGTFTEGIRPNTSGLPTFKTKPADTVSTNEQRDYRYPTIRR